MKKKFISAKILQDGIATSPRDVVLSAEVSLGSQDVHDEHAEEDLHEERRVTRVAPVAKWQTVVGGGKCLDLMFKKWNMFQNLTN